jgi:F420-non-reducing hydrogenase iron-sulfur subunit
MSDSTPTPPAASTSWTPRIVAFFCNWCTYTAADLAGVSRMKYAANTRTIRVMCSGRVDPQFVLEAFARGADGVLIGGCHPNDCHYAEGNYKMLRRFELLQRLLKDMGIAPERFRLEWISAAEGEKVKSVINDMVRKLTELGPLDMPGKFVDWDREIGELASRVSVEGEEENKEPVAATQTEG